MINGDAFAVAPAEIMARLDTHHIQRYLASPVALAQNGNISQTITINGDFWCYNISVWGYDTAGKIIQKLDTRDIFSVTWGDQLREYQNTPTEPFELNDSGPVNIYKGLFLYDRDLVHFNTVSIGIPAAPVLTFPVYFWYILDGYILGPKPPQG